MEISSSQINNQSVFINNLIVPTGLDLLTVPNKTAYEGSLAYEPSSGGLYYADSVGWQLIAEATSSVLITNFGVTPNAKGLTLAANILNMEPASDIFPGGVSVVSQSFGGAKTFIDTISVPDENISGNLNMLLANSIVSSGVIRKNGVEFLHNYGTRNTFCGLNSGNFTMTGVDNTVYGYTGADVTTSGSRNCSFGSLAFDSSTTGNDNCAFGYNTLTQNVSGSGNTAIGSGSLTNVVAGLRNTGLGFSTLNSVTNGSDNIAIGYNAGQTVTNGSRNVLINSVVAGILTNGDDNIFISTIALSPTESNTIRFGVSTTHTRAFIAGISGVLPTGTLLPMFINSLGQIGTQSLTTGIVQSLAGDIYSASNISMDNTVSSVTGVISKGGDRFLHNYGTNNTFLGKLSGNFTMAANSNTAVGAGSFTLNTTGNANTAIGHRSLEDNTIGAFNTGVGFGTLSASVNNSNCTAVGSGALFNSTANELTAVGFDALRYNTTGTRNSGLGYQVSWANSTGSDNTAFGHNTLRDNNTGSCNTAVGSSALLNSTASNLTAVGFEALKVNTTGLQNSAFGYRSLSSITITSGNTAFGYQALLSNIGSNNTAVGTSALSTSTVSSNVAVGFEAMKISSTGQFNVAVGTSALAAGTTAGSCVCIGNTAGAAITTGIANICIGSGAGGVLTTGSNNIYIGLNANTAADANVCKINSIRGRTTASATGITVLIDANGQLGTISSRRELKENIIAMDEETNRTVINKLQPVRFDYKASKGCHPTYGLIAEDVFQVDPSLTVNCCEGNLETVYYNHIPMLLLTEVQRLNKVIDQMNIKITLLEAR